MFLLFISLLIIANTAWAEMPQVRQAGAGYYAIRGNGWCWALPYHTADTYFPAGWMPLDEAGKKYGWENQTPEQQAICTTQYVVSPNPRSSDNTRPVKDPVTWKVIGRVSVGTACGQELVKEINSVQSWRPVIGGVAVCEEQ